MNIHFEPASLEHRDLIFGWLQEPHIVEFWDNSQSHKDDILNFIHHRKQVYFYGTTRYWIGSIEDDPYSFLLSDILNDDDGLSEAHRKHMSPTGHSLSLDFAIPDPRYLGKGLAALTLEAFVYFYQDHIDSQAESFFIDPAANNPRACHVYSKAGFVKVGEDIRHADTSQGSLHHVMVKKLKRPCSVSHAQSTLLCV